MKAITDRIRAVMKEQQITSKMLAEQLQVSPGAVSNYLNDRRCITPVMLREICRLLDVSADYVLGLSICRHPNELLPEEQQLLAIYRALPPDGKSYVLMQLRQFGHFCRTIRKHPI